MWIKRVPAILVLSLILGTANPMNLLTNPSDDRPEGGWELLRLSLPSGLHVYLPIAAR